MGGVLWPLANQASPSEGQGSGFMDLGSPGWRLRPWQGSRPDLLLPRVGEGKDTGLRASEPGQSKGKPPTSP